MRIADVLLPALKARFPGRGLRCGESPDPVAIFPAAHEAVGDVSILDDGDEATVLLGCLTHSHFNYSDSTHSKKERAEEITATVLEFLEALFDDKVLIWVAVDRGSGGWARIGPGSSIALRQGAKNFVWSGPIDTIGESKSQESRKQTVARLVAYELPIEPVLQALAAFPFDCEELVHLRRSDLLAILDRFLAGRLTADQVTDWADQVELRDDVGLEVGFEIQLRDAIFRLANPILNEPVTSELAMRLRADFSDSLS
jgi:hypothetical protein